MSRCQGLQIIAGTLAPGHSCLCLRVLLPHPFAVQQVNGHIEQQRPQGRAAQDNPDITRQDRADRTFKG